jgi:hypothetical protein
MKYDIQDAVKEFRELAKDLEGTAEGEKARMIADWLGVIARPALNPFELRAMPEDVKKYDSSRAVKHMSLILLKNYYAKDVQEYEINTFIATQIIEGTVIAALSSEGHDGMRRCVPHIIAKQVCEGSRRLDASLFDKISIFDVAVLILKWFDYEVYDITGEGNSSRGKVRFDDRPWDWKSKSGSDFHDCVRWMNAFRSHVTKMKMVKDFLNKMNEIGGIE